MTGTVFSIQEFSVYDGPGIRASVFLKGCPLRCSWCHNPEGQTKEPQISKNPNGCCGCGACLAHAVQKDGATVYTEESMAVCPDYGFVLSHGFDALQARITAAMAKTQEKKQLDFGRVWGWSGYFNELDKPYQDHIIRRLEYRG